MTGHAEVYIWTVSSSWPLSQSVDLQEHRKSVCRSKETGLKKVWSHEDGLMSVFFLLFSVVPQTEMLDSLTNATVLVVSQSTEMLDSLINATVL